MTLDLAYDIIL